MRDKLNVPCFVSGFTLQAIPPPSCFMQQPNFLETVSLQSCLHLYNSSHFPSTTVSCSLGPLLTVMLTRLHPKSYVTARGGRDIEHTPLLISGRGLEHASLHSLSVYQTPALQATNDCSNVVVHYCEQICPDITTCGNKKGLTYIVYLEYSFDSL